MFPVLALLALGVLWGATASLIRIERANAERAALASTRELVETYHAQVVRAVREIDATLKVLQYAVMHHDHHGDLEHLRERGLLPPDLLFVVSLVDREGNVASSTRPLPLTNVAHREYFREQRLADGLQVSVPRQDPESGDWVLRFSRRLEDEGGDFAGVAMVSVAADFFVSGYEAAKLGEEGVLGLLGTDGVFRARRTGEAITHGEVVDYAMSIGAMEEEIQVALAVNPWDGVLRYTGAQQLYDAALTVVVGLSEAEQMAVVARQARIYRGRAAVASAALIVVLAALGRLAWQLAASRKQAYLTQIEHAKQIEHLAYHDKLTGLPNRSLFSTLLHQAILGARRYDRQLAVLFLDLDRFKHINDTLGHEAGDELLKEVAQRLRASLRDSDSVARLGGDEFVVLLPELMEETYAGTVAHKMLAAIARPFVLLGQEFRVTGSVGVATYPRDGLDEQTLTKNADIAMYKAKEQGKNNYQFYSERMNTESLERLTLESSLRHALEHEEFELHYQPKRDLKTGRITGMEALLRWQHPDLGTVAPMQFIAIAEQSGLILPLGKWVLRTACQQNVDWQKAGLPKLAMAVNMTPLQFNDEHLLADIAAILEATGMEANLLELEITESLLTSDVERTGSILTGLKELGIRIAVDDFGLGYTTLSALRRFPLDTIKIDRSFVRELHEVDEDRVLTEAIIAMGKSLSLTVVAQGVETKEQVDFLREHACDELQGFYFNQPLPAAQFAAVLSAQTGAPGLVELAARKARRPA